MIYIFVVLLVAVGYYIHDKLTDIWWFRKFLLRCRSEIRYSFPYWVGGLIPRLTWYVVLTLAFLTPFWVLNWLGLQLNWGLVFAFVGGIVLFDVISDTLNYLTARRIVLALAQDEPAVANFIKTGNQKVE